MYIQSSCTNVTLTLLSKYFTYKKSTKYINIGKIGYWRYEKQKQTYIEEHKYMWVRERGGVGGTGG